MYSLKDSFYQGDCDGGLWFYMKKVTGVNSIFVFINALFSRKRCVIDDEIFFFCSQRLFSYYPQANLDMTDSMGPGKLVRHMQIRHIHMTNTCYAWDWDQAYRPS